MRITNPDTLRRARALAILMLALPLFAANAAHPALAQADCRTFPETGKTVCGKFLDYWNNNGQLAQQGFPISEQMSEQSDTDGKIYTVQYFERALFELHPEFAGTPNEVLLTLLGVFLYQQKYPQGAPNQVPSADAGARLFPETGKKVGGPFLSYWDSHGALRQQGLPISDEFIEISALDGKPYKVQYFERAVFEFHTEFAGTPNEVLLSQLGTYRYRDEYQTPAATPTVPATPTRPGPIATPTNVPPTATPQAGDPCAGIPASIDVTVTPTCGPPGTRFDFEGRGFQPGEPVGVYATTPDGSVYGGNFQLEADGEGNAGGVYITTFPGDPTGVWAITYEGVTSHKKSIGYFKVAEIPAGPCDPAGSVNGSAEPSTAGPGDTITFNAQGFSPTEAVSYWFTLPNGEVFGTTEPTNEIVNPDGTIGPLELPVDILLFLGTGKWAITFQGEDTEHQAIIYFCLHE